MTALDDEVLLTGPEAAALAQRSVATIRSWRHRGHLQAAGLDTRERPMYRRDDVYAAERAARQRERAPRERGEAGRFIETDYAR